MIRSLLSDIKLIFKKYNYETDNEKDIYINNYNNSIDSIDYNYKIINYKDGYLSDSFFFIWRKEKKKRLYYEIQEIIGNGKLKNSPSFLESIYEE